MQEKEIRAGERGCQAAVGHGGVQKQLELYTVPESTQENGVKALSGARTFHPRTGEAEAS